MQACISVQLSDRTCKVYVVTTDIYVRGYASPSNDRPSSLTFDVSSIDSDNRVYRYHVPLATCTSPTSEHLLLLTCGRPNTWAWYQWTRRRMEPIKALDVRDSQTYLLRLLLRLTPKHFTRGTSDRQHRVSGFPANVLNDD